ncbi:MAG: hypothetical protein JWO36_6917 [Myxococcales bacterium]|nr:hypothetical protein [Myxococcales bacterium]
MHTNKLLPARGTTGLLVAGLLAGCGVDHPAPDPQPQPPATHDEMLKGLGFNTDLGGPQDPSGNPLPPDYNPLRKQFGVFHPKAELYVAGTLFDNGAGNAPKKEVLFDDKSAASSFSRMTFGSPIDDTWSQAQYKNGIAADLDGDGLDEFFITYWVQATSELRYIILDPGGSVFHQGVLISGAPSPAALPDWSQPALAKGDFAGVGHDQIAIGFVGLYIVDVASDGTITTTNRPLTGNGWTYDNLPVFVAAGDLDGDKNDELAVSFSTANGTAARYRIYDNTTIVRDDYMMFNDPEPGWGVRNVEQATVAIGDVDGDHLGEVVFYGRTQGGNGQVFVLDDLVHAPAQTNGWMSFHHGDCCWGGEIPHPLATVDFDGDGVKEVFAQHRILKLDTGAKTAAGTPTSTDTQVFELFSSSPYNRPRVTVGDVDGDGKEDLVVETDWQILALGLDALEHAALKKAWPHGEQTGGWGSVILAAGNIDNDSAIVKFDGVHELLFTDPNIVAVVSAPPYWDGIGQDVSNTKSTFGRKVDMSAEEKTSLGFSVGWSIGTKENFLFGEAESKLTVEQSMDFSSYSSHSISRSLSYTTGAGTDLVVFTAIPFDVYYYTIQSSPNPAEIGKKVTINVARKPQTLATDPTFYNEHTLATTQKIDAGVLKHTVGDPTSYPIQGDKDAIARMPQAAIGQLATSPQSGTTTSTIELANGSGSGQSMNLSVTMSWNVSATDGPEVGGSVGFQYGYEYKVSTESTTFYQGSVGAIPTAAFSDHLYNFGLMAYPETLGQQKFARLDYWVE